MFTNCLQFICFCLQYTVYTCYIKFILLKDEKVRKKEKHILFFILLFYFLYNIPLKEKNIVFLYHTNVQCI